MALKEITIKVPEELLRDAAEFDLLTDETVAALLQEELDRRVMELVNAEIKAYRAEKSEQQKP